MAAGSSTVKVTYLGDASSLARASRQAEQASGQVEKKLGGLRRAAVVGGALAGAALLKFGKDSVKAFGEAEQQSAMLDLAMRKFPKTADVTRESFDKLNTSIQRKTGFDDDALASGEAVLAQFDLTGKQIQSLTPLLADYAAKTGKDIPTAATDLGRAFLGNTRALKELGISYKSTGDKARDQAAIQELLAQKVGGTAEAMGQTASGKARILSTEFENLQEKAGAKLVPALTQVAEVGLKVIDFVDRNSAVIVPLVAVVATLVTGIKLWTMAQAALNIVLALNPIGIVVIALVALAAGLVVAYQKSETFRDVVRGAFGAVGAAGTFLWDKVLRPTFSFITGAFLAVAGAIVHGAATAFGWIPGLGGKLKDAAAKFDEFRDDVNDALSGIKDRDVHVTAVLTQGVVNRHERDIDGQRAAGGPVARGKTYLVGEHGPELFTADQGGTIIPNGGGGARPGGPGGTARLQPIMLQLDSRTVWQGLLRLKRDGGVSLELA